jgi:hypothetical protein
MLFSGNVVIVPELSLESLERASVVLGMVASWVDVIPIWPYFSRCCSFRTMASITLALGLAGLQACDCGGSCALLHAAGGGGGCVMSKIGTLQSLPGW